MGRKTRTQFGVVSNYVFSNAQVLTWPTAPFTLLQGVTGNVWLPQACWVELNPWFADYTNVDGGATITLEFAGTTLFIPLNLPYFVTGILQRGAAGGEMATMARVKGVLSSMVNANLELHLNNGGAGNLTGGNAGNALHVRLFYSQYTLP